MFSERAISQAHAQCVRDPLEIGNTLYRLYLDQPHLELMMEVCKRLNQNQRQWAIDQLEKNKSKLQREGNGDWHNVAQCITLCKHTQNQSSYYRLRTICDKWLTYKMQKRFVVILICLIALLTVINGLMIVSRFSNDQEFHEALSYCHQLTTTTCNVTLPPFCQSAFFVQTHLKIYPFAKWLACVVITMLIIQGGLFVYSHCCCGKHKQTAEVIANGGLIRQPREQPLQLQQGKQLRRPLLKDNPTSLKSDLSYQSNSLHEQE